jgi:hypothetical protein
MWKKENTMPFDRFLKESLVSQFAGKGKRLVVGTQNRNEPHDFQLGIDKGDHSLNPNFSLTYYRREDLKRGVNTDFSIEEADVLMFSMPLIYFIVTAKQRQVVHSDPIEQVTMKLRLLTQKVGKLEDFYLSYHTDEGNKSFNLDREWTKVSLSDKVAQKIQRGVEMYPRLNRLATEVLQG